MRIEIEGECAMELKLLARDKYVRKYLNLNRVCVWDSIEGRDVFECLLR